MLKTYSHCIYCNSKKLIKIQKQKFRKNFYIETIMLDLNLSEKILRKMKVYKCKNCKILQNNPWFDDHTLRKIYANIYGQHNRGWSNMLNFIKNKKLPDHGNVYNLLIKNYKIRSYAEFNNPFTGLFLNFFNNEFSHKQKFFKNYFKNNINYLTSRQVVEKSTLLKKKAALKGKHFLDSIIKFRDIKKRKICKKFLFVDNSSLTWGQNDNFKSVNSKSLASEFFDLNIVDINSVNYKKKIDIFGIFHTLDHTFEPKRILDLALKISKIVVVYAHVDDNLNKQHLFSITPGFLDYLKKNKIYNVNLTKKIQKKFKSPELYFACSKKKLYLKKLSKLI